jgi:ribosomal protein L7Ae-like RNA K-turn-binding protein
LVILASDGSEAQHRKVLPLARARDVPLVFVGGRAELGAALGAGPLTAVAVTGEGFARELKQRLQQDG